MSYFNSGSALVAWQVWAAIPLCIMHVLNFGMDVNAMIRTSNTVTDWSNPANGHLSNHMNAVYRKAISVNPYHVMGTQLGVSAGCLLFTPLIAWILWYGGERGRFNGNTLVAGFFQLLLIFANFVPGALGWISLNYWGCSKIVYGTDRSNATENGKSRDACNDYKGASTLMLMAAGLYVFCFLSSVIFAVRGIAHKTARNVRSRSNV